MRAKGLLIGKSILLLLAGALLGTLLLMLVYRLPVNIENRDTSYALIETEGWYPRASVTALSLDAYFHSYLPDVLDDSTDRIMLYTALDTSTDLGGYWNEPWLRTVNMSGIILITGMAM